MTYTENDLTSLRQTGGTMRRLASEYRDDMAAHATKSVLEVYEVVKNIPYRTDPKGLEFVMRPRYTLNGEGQGGDCDDKCVCMMAWCNLNGVPFRVLAVGLDVRQPLHHVVLECKIEGKWIHVDATYPRNSFGVPMGTYGAREYI